MMNLLTPQVPHAERILTALYLKGIAIDQSETGCGKTYVATYVAKRMNVPLVVICPKAVIPNWIKVLKLAGISPSVIMNYEKLCRGNTPYLSYDHKKFNKKKVWESEGIKVDFPKNSLVIMDEVHKCKGTYSLNGSMLIAVKNAGYKMLLMSATAATNMLEMKALGFSAQLHNGYNFCKWCVSMGAEFNQRFGGMTIDLQDAKVKQGMRMIHTNLFEEQKISSRLTRKEMGSIFPDNRIFAETFDMGANTAKINAVYDQMEAEIARLDDRAQSYRDHVFAAIMKARRMAELLKVPTMVEMIEDLYEEGMSPVVFVNFKETVDALLSRLSSHKDTIAMIVGGQNPKVRQQYLDEFQGNKRRIMIANLAAGNCGVDMHDLDGNFPRFSIISPSFSAINLIQSLGRCHRANGRSPVIQKIMFASNTIEERICQRIQSKLDNLDLINDGDLIGEINIWSN